MSQLTHPRVRFVDTGFTRTWLAGLAAVVVLTIPAALLASSHHPAAHVTTSSASGLRYDGGPSEGTRGLSVRSRIRGDDRTDMFGRRP
ncbi:MAG TPA: hypothetical protein VGF21_09015 [Thermoleophilaceae bacterium]